MVSPSDGLGYAFSFSKGVGAEVGQSRGGISSSAQTPGSFSTAGFFVHLESLEQKARGLLQCDPVLTECPRYEVR